MFNKTIFKQTLKENIKLWLIFTVVTSVVLAILVVVFEPTTISGMTEMVEGTALADMLKNTTFLGMLSSSFFTLQGVLLPVVYIILTANSLIASQVDKGSMAYILSTPTKRGAVVITQALYLILALAIMHLIITLVGFSSIQIFQSDVDINMSKFFMLNLGLFILMFSTSSISFMFSCIFNLSKNSIALGAGIPIAFFLFELMSTVSESLEKIKYVSINTLFDKDAILAGDSIILQFTILVIIGIILYGIGIQIFKKKDLPL